MVDSPVPGAPIIIPSIQPSGLANLLSKLQVPGTLRPKLGDWSESGRAQCPFKPPSFPLPPMPANLFPNPGVTELPHHGNFHSVGALKMPNSQFPRSLSTKQLGLGVVVGGLRPPPGLLGAGAGFSNSGCTPAPPRQTFWGRSR